jgi:signal transduction histidine kinase
MAINFHQPSVHALFNAMPLPLLTFGVDGMLTFANSAAKIHPGKPIDAMSGKPVIKALVRDITLGKIKLPYPAEVEVSGGMRLKGQFMAGMSGLDIAFVAAGEAKASGPQAPERKGIAEVMAMLRDEVGPPLKKFTGLLRDLPESPEGEQLEEAAEALNQRLRRLSDLIAVFGETVLNINDRIELVPLVRSVCESLQPKALSLRVHFEITEPTQTLPPIYGNAELIRRALHECFDNALVHSRKEVNRQQDLSVKITYTFSGEHILLSVRNQGAIPEEEKGVETRDMFIAKKNANGESVNGKIGLPLVQRIVGLHGGNMRMSAVGDDEVRVMMEFPTGAPQRGQAQLDIAQAQRYAADLAQLMSRRKKEAS